MTTGTSDLGTARAGGALVNGTRARLVQVQATVGTGPPGFTIIGVPGASADFRAAVSAPGD